MSLEGGREGGRGGRGREGRGGEGGDGSALSHFGDIFVCF